MYLRKVLNFKDILGMTIPGAISRALGIKHGDHVEVYLGDKKTILVRKHEVDPIKIKLDDVNLTNNE